MNPINRLAEMLGKHAEDTAAAFAKSSEAVEKIARTASMTEQNLRFALAIFGAAVAMQPGIDSRKLLADFDKQLEANTPPAGNIPMPALDLRAALAKVAAAKGPG